MGLRDKIKEAIEEFDWINDIDSKVEEETIEVLYNKPFYWYSPLEKSKWVSFQGMPKIFWLEDGIDSAEVNVCSHQHSKEDFYAKDCSPFFRSTVVNKFDRGIFVLQPQLTNINESKNDFDWLEDVVPEEYKFFTVYTDDGIVGGSYFIKVPNLKNLEYDLDDCCPIDIPVTKEEAEDFLDWATSEKEFEDRDYEYIQHVRQISREEYCRAFGNYRDEDRNDMNICGRNKEGILENNEFDWIEDTNPKELESPYDFILEYFTKNTNNKYKGYEYGLDNFMGVVEWVPTKEGMLDFYIYATPFHDDGDDLPIEAVDADGYQQTLFTKEIPKFQYEMELVNWLENEYPKIVYKEIEEFSSEVLTEDMDRVCYKPRGYKNLEEFKKVIEKSAKKYKSPIEWKRGDKNLYEKAVSHYKNKCKKEGSIEFIKSITSHFISGKIKHTKNDLEKIAKSFERKGQWREESKTKNSKYFGTYRQAHARNRQLEKNGEYGWFESITKHMPNVVYDEKHVYEIYLQDKKTKKDVAVYVGLTCDLESRIREHETGEGRYCKRESKSPVNDYLNEKPNLTMRVVKKTKLPVEKEKAQSMEDKLIKKHDSKGDLEVLNKGATGVGVGSLGPLNKGRKYLSQIEDILKNNEFNSRVEAKEYLDKYFSDKYGEKNVFKNIIRSNKNRALRGKTSLLYQKYLELWNEYLENLPSKDLDYADIEKVKDITKDFEYWDDVEEYDNGRLYNALRARYQRNTEGWRELFSKLRNLGTKEEKRVGDIKKAVKTLIDQEDPNNRLSDTDLAQKIKELGLGDYSRRVLYNYRVRMGIPKMSERGN